MSWLVAVTFPGLLMIATIGLHRLEDVLQGSHPWAAGLVAGPGAGAPAPASSNRFDPLLLIDEPGLPTRPNPLFAPSDQPIVCSVATNAETA